MTAIKITHGSDGKLLVSSPYHPDFPRGARNLGGRWDGAVWRFDPRDEDDVRSLCLDVYGTDGAACPLATLRVTWLFDDHDPSLSLWVAGRQVARAYGRDSGARLGEGVILRKGRFGSAGSRNNPTVTAEKGTVVEIRDVPLDIALREAEQGASTLKVEIIAATVDLDEIEALSASAIRGADNE